MRGEREREKNNNMQATTKPGDRETTSEKTNETKSAATQNKAKQQTFCLHRHEKEGGIASPPRLARRMWGIHSDRSACVPAFALRIGLYWILVGLDGMGWDGIGLEFGWGLAG